MINSIVKLIIKESGESFIGTGTFIKYKDTVLLATAAHCVYDFLKKKKMLCIEVLYRSKFSIRKLYVKDVFVNDDWRKNGLLNHDFAICTLETEPKFPSYVFPVETSVSFTKKNNRKVNMIGIHECLFFDKENRFYGLPNLKFWKSDNLLGGAIKFSKGASGGPLLIKENNGLKKQIGVISSVLSEYPNYSWGVVWGKEIFPLLRKAVS